MNEYKLIATNSAGMSVDLYNDSAAYLTSIDGIDYEADVKTSSIGSADGSVVESIRIPERVISIKLEYDSLAGNSEEAKLRVHRVFESKDPITLRYISPNQDKFIRGYCQSIDTPPNIHPMVTAISIICPDPFWSDEEFDGETAGRGVTLNVYDDSGNILGKIDRFISLMWTRRASSSGDFELKVPVDTNALELLRPVRFLSRSDTGEVMYISSVRDNISEDGEATITAAGYGVSGLLKKLAMPLTPSLYKGYASIDGTVTEVSLVYSLINESSAGGSAAAETGKLGTAVACLLMGVEILPYIHSESAEHYASMDIESYLREVAKTNRCNVIEGESYTIYISKPRESECIFSPELSTSRSVSCEYADEGAANAVRVICSMPSEGVSIGRPGTDTAKEYFVKSKEYEQIIKSYTEQYGEHSFEVLQQKQAFEDYKRSLLPVYFGTYESEYPSVDPNFVLDGTRYSIKTETISPVVITYSENGSDYSFVDLDETRNLAVSTIRNRLDMGNQGITESYSADVTNAWQYRKDYDIGDIVTVKTLRGNIRRSISEVQECFEEGTLKINVTFGDVLKTIIDDYSDKTKNAQTENSRTRTEIQNNIRVGAVIGGSTVSRSTGFTWDDSDMSEEECVDGG